MAFLGVVVLMGAGAVVTLIIQKIIKKIKQRKKGDE